MGDDSFETNFAHNIYPWQPTGFPYDFDSIMHYPAFATSTCSNCPVITYKDTDQAVETNDSGTFSAIDIKEVLDFTLTKRLSLRFIDQ